MVQQFTFADSKFNGKRRKTRKETFLGKVRISGEILLG